MSAGGDLFRPQEGIGAHGAWVSGPPWILGRRGAPREAPENTLASLRRAVELGLDGFAYELRAALSGELVLLADAGLERTTDLTGALATKTMPELAAADAGSWFGKAFSGEPLVLLEETFELPGNRAGSAPQHLIELAEPGLVGEVARALAGGGRRLSVRVASAHLETCAEARALGLEALWIAPEPSPKVRELVRERGVAAVGLVGRAWPAGDWPTERWALDVDDPDLLLALMRLPVNGLTTTEPRRALATRALALLAGNGLESYPLRVPPLAMDPSARLPGPGEWCGRWELVVEVANPFPFDVRVALELAVRRGVFEAEGLPAGARLGPGESAAFAFTLTGGSWRLGGDPLLLAHYFWERGPGRPREHLVLDAPLERRRSLRLGGEVRRVELVRERPDDPPASMTLRRFGGQLVAAIENPGGLAEARALVHLDGAVHRGGKSVRLSLPADFTRRAGGVPFSVGIAGRREGGAGPGAELVVRRWAGGLPDTLSGGAPGRLLPA